MTSQTHISPLPFESSHPAFAGHFPGRPIIPGVQLLDRAKCIVESQCGLALMGLQAAKFLSPAGPGDVLELEYSIAEKYVRFEIRCAMRKVASGQFIIADSSAA